MPSTLPAHPAAVLPLKLWRPGWFDGVALVAGSAAPDVAYLCDGFGFPVQAHRWPAALWFGLPAALLVTLLIRHGAPTVAAHLPDRPGLLALPDYGALGGVRRGWWKTVVSALLGIATHLLWDLPTHAGLVGSWRQLSYLSHIGGGLITVLFAIHLGRHRLIRRWHGPPPPRPVRQRLFWSTASGLTVAGVVLASLPSAISGHHVWGVRVIATVMVALLAAATAVTLTTGANDATNPLSWWGRRRAGTG